ncbi:MAG: glutamate--tRNA ligase family protein [bacterium]
MTDKKVVTRFAPSPTGHLHIGGVRSALFNYLWARKHGGEFLLRIEDTDKERSKKEFEDSILESFKWLGLSYDAMYRQSENTEVYKKYLEQLIADDKAYISKEEPKEPGDRDSVIRFRNPNKVVTFDDKIMGTISIDTTDLGDFVIAKDFETPVFHFANVVDDFEMGITLVMRGQEHAPNTPRQILIWEAFGWELPEYAHIPLILAPDKTKLSKRHGALDTREYRNLGYLPEAITNFMALIGWNPGTEQEIFSLTELIEQFDLARVQKSAGVFNIEKLDWMNREYIKLLGPDATQSAMLMYIPNIIRNLTGYSNEMTARIAPIIMERISKWSDITTLAEAGELTYYFEQPVYEKDALFFAKTKLTTDTKYTELIAIIEGLKMRLEALENTDWNTESIKKSIWDYTESVGRGDALWPMRYALSGKDKSPDPFILSEVLGKEETLKRLDIAIQKLQN